MNNVMNSPLVHLPFLMLWKAEGRMWGRTGRLSPEFLLCFCVRVWMVSWMYCTSSIQKIFPLPEGGWKQIMPFHRYHQQTEKMTAGEELVCIMQGANGWCLLEHGSDNLVIWRDVLLQAMWQQLVLGNNDFAWTFRAQRGKLILLYLSYFLLWNTSSVQENFFLLL